MSDSSSTSGTSRGLPAALTHVLEKVKRRHLLLKLAEFPLTLAAGLCTAWLLQALADRVFNLPWAARCVLLALDAAAAMWLFSRCVIQPWRRRLDLKGAALLIERRMPEFRTSLISAVELGAPDSESSPQVRPLVEHLVADVTQKVTTGDVIAKVIDGDALRNLAAKMAAPVVLVLLLLAFCRPTSGLLLRRVLLSQDELPTSTQVISVTGDLLVDAGGEARLSARATGEIPPDGKVVITRAGHPAEVVPVAPAAAGSADFSQSLTNVRESFSYHFELNDGISREHQVTVRFPPEPKELHFVEIPPAYTKLPQAELVGGSLKLLEGSILRVAGIASKRLRGGEVRISGLSEPVKLVVKQGAEFETEIPVPASGWKTLTLHLTGSDGDESNDDTVYPIELRRDTVPTAAIRIPKEESITVIPNDTLPLAFQITDDFGISGAKLCYRVVRMLPDGGSEDAEEGEVKLKVPDDIRDWKYQFTWNLALITPQVTTGYNIIFWIEATDNHSPEPVTNRSEERTIRVISEQEKRLELLTLLGQKATEIEKLYDQQRAINDSTARP